MAGMPDVLLAHTHELEHTVRVHVRQLLDDAFQEDFSDQDWEHCLGGIHAIVRDGHRIVGHGAVVQRRLVHGGQALRAGYVEGLAIVADRRGEGLGGALMEALEKVVRGAYDLGALASTEEALGFYTARGWQPWRGPTFALTPAGSRRTRDDDGGVFVLPGAAPLDLDSSLTCDWRDGDVW
jgi:aminoglycoside 2'-N-acetyltransferase I